jgi:hypothetical protein
MMKPILLGSALLFAIPALAQTTGGTQGSGTATTTSDHDPTMEADDAGVEGAATTTSQVNGGIRSSTGNAGTAATQGSTGQDHSGMNHGSMNHGAAGQGTATTGGTMSGGTTRSSTGSATMSGGNGGSMGTGSMGTGSMAGSGSGAYTGVGGPAQGAGSYPPCSRTRTDSCIQTNERGRRR